MNTFTSYLLPMPTGDCTNEAMTPSPYSLNVLRIHFPLTQPMSTSPHLIRTHCVFRELANCLVRPGWQLIWSYLCVGMENWSRVLIGPSQGHNLNLSTCLDSHLVPMSAWLGCAWWPASASSAVCCLSPLASMLIMVYLITIKPITDNYNYNDILKEISYWLYFTLPHQSKYLTINL